MNRVPLHPRTGRELAQPSTPPGVRRAEACHWPFDNRGQAQQT